MAQAGRLNLCRATWHCAHSASSNILHNRSGIRCLVAVHLYSTSVYDHKGSLSVSKQRAYVDGLLETFAVQTEELGLKYLSDDDLRHRFDAFDTNQDGKIDLKEARRLLEQAGNKDVSIEDATKFVTAIDTNNDGLVSWNEFRSAVHHIAEPIDSRIKPISATLVLNFIGQGVLQPVLPTLARELEMTAADLGLVIASNAIVRMICNAPLAVVVNKFGRRPLLVIGPAIGSVAMLCMGSCTTFEALLMCNALAGVGGAAVMTGASLYLSDISTPRNRSRTTAPLTMTALTGFALGPAIGGFLAESDLRAPFYVCSMGMGFASLIGFVVLPETLRNSVSVSTERSKVAGWELWGQLMRRPSLQALFFNVFTTGFRIGAQPVATVIFAMEVLGMSPSMIGSLFMAQVLGMFMVTTPASILSDRAAKKNKRLYVMVPGVVFTSIATGLQPLCEFLSVTHPSEAFALLGVIGAMGNALVGPNVAAFVMDHTEEAERAQALAMRTLFQDLGALFGATCMGAVAASFGPACAIHSVAALQMCTAVALAIRGSAKRNF